MGTPKTDLGQPDPPQAGELLERIYFQGLSLETKAQEQLLDRQMPTELKDALRRMWAAEQATFPALENIPEVSRQVWQNLTLPEQIGSFEIKGILGRGGMGTVYQAWQADLERPVALKVISTEEITEEERLHFRREQKLLSRLQHPNVAVILETGFTDEQQPFFAMEYLEGSTITHYCDQQRLSIEQRLRLFLDVCNGLQHAHQRRVIHCDIKPSNVMVIDQDGRALAKLIDFGVARPLQTEQSSESEKAAHGTVAYMSPEQADLTGKQTVDTRADVYGLGALLYELLTGAGPLEAALRESATLQDKIQIIQSYPLLPASAHFDNGSITATERAAVRNAQPRKMRWKLRGELECILKKALAKTPDDRYESCSALRDDIQNYLKGLPVSAAGNSANYVMGKWLKRHLRVAFAAFLSVATLIGLLFITRAALNEAVLAKRKQQSVHEFAVGLFRDVNPYQAKRDIRVEELLDHGATRVAGKYGGQPDLEAGVRMVLGRSYQDLGFWKKARIQYHLAAGRYSESKASSEQEKLQAVYAEAYVLSQLQKLTEAERQYRLGLREAAEKLGNLHPLTLTFSSGLAYALKRQKRFEEATQLFEATIANQQRVLGAKDVHTRRTRTNYAGLLLDTGNTEQALRIYREYLEPHSPEDKEASPFLLTLQHGMVRALYEQDQIAEAEKLARQVLERRRRLLGKTHPETLKTASNLARIVGEAHSPGKAVAILQQNLAFLDETQRRHPVGLILAHNLGHFLTLADDTATAVTVLEKTWKQRVAVLGKDHPNTLSTRFTLAKAWLKKGDRDIANNIFEATCAQTERLLGARHPVTLEYHQTWQQSKNKPYLE